MTDKKKTNKRKLSTLVKQQVPEFVLTDHPKFTEFLSSYFLFMESAELNLESITDIDNIVLESGTTATNFVLIDRTDNFGLDAGDKLVLEENAKDKVIEYVPHGINPKEFFPIQEGHKDYQGLLDFKKELFKGKDIDFVVFFNSRNIQRKHAADNILAYRLFCDMIGEEAAKKCAFVLKTEISSQHGTDLKAVKDTFCDPSYVNVMFATEKLSAAQMNLLYNIADVTTLISSNEGWGLALTEAMMAGTMIIPNATGGMQDQARFEDEDGNWIDFDSDFPSNHRGTYKKCGEWALPVFPSNLSMMGSPLTPYIFDDRCNPEDAANRILEAYNMGREERNRRGLKGHEFALSDESGFSSQKMSDNIIRCTDKTIKEFKPRPQYDITKVEEYKPLTVKHKLTGY